MRRGAPRASQGEPNRLQNVQLSRVRLATFS
jgi:hypothetical protein